MTDIVDRNVVVLAPEKRRVGKRRAVSNHIQGCRLPLPFRDDPMLYPDGLTRIGVGPSSDIACCVDTRDTRLEELVDNDPSIKL